MKHLQTFFMKMLIFSSADDAIFFLLYVDHNTIKIDTIWYHLLPASLKIFEYNIITSTY